MTRTNEKELKIKSQIKSAYEKAYGRRVISMNYPFSWMRISKINGDIEIFPYKSESDMKELSRKNSSVEFCMSFDDAMNMAVLYSK